MNWNRKHTAHLLSLKTNVRLYAADNEGGKFAFANKRRANYIVQVERQQYDFEQKRHVAKMVDRKPYGTRGYVKSERQYVLDRFRNHFQVDIATASDQAVWAKYRRVNDMANNNANVAAVAIATTYVSSESHVTVAKGMNLPDAWKALGLTRLGRGATRTVYDLGDGTVLKVRNGNQGWADGRKSNLRELGVFKKIAGTPNKDMVAEIFAACPDGEWLVMEKVARHGQQTSFADAARHSAIKRVLRSARYNVSDLHGGNWGNRADGTLVAVDYASA